MRLPGTCHNRGAALAAARQAFARWRSRLLRPGCPGGCRRGLLPVGLVLAGCFCSPGYARDPAPALASDRPGLGDGASVMAPGALQLEVGGRLREFGGTRGGEGTALVRRGLAAAELRLYLPSPLAIQGGDPNWIEAGFATAVNQNFQWDLNSAYDTKSGDWFFGIGFSKRWLP